MDGKHKMIEDKRNLQGSLSRDIFKRLHKQKCDSDHYATDADLVLVAKNPYRVVAGLDYKQYGDEVSFTEAILYNWFIDRDVPVYLIYSQSLNGFPDSVHRFDLYRYYYADPGPDPPIVEKELKAQDLTWKALNDWETRLIEESKRRNNERTD